MPARLSRTTKTGDLEGDPEAEEGAHEERQVVVELHQVGEVRLGEPDQDLQALGQGDVAQDDAGDEQRAGDDREDQRPALLLPVQAGGG